MSKKEDILRKNTISILAVYKEMPFEDILKRAFYTIKPSKKRISVMIIIFILMLCPSFIIIKSNNTIEILNEIIKTSNDILITIFGVIFTGYALFQALINKKTLEVLFLNKGKKEILFDEYNLFFFEFIIIYLLVIVFNYIIYLFLTIIGLGYSNLLVEFNNLIIIIFAICISLYITIIISLIIEVKSFIFNLFQCFNLSACSSMVEHLKDLENNK